MTITTATELRQGLSRGDKAFPRMSELDQPTASKVGLGPLLRETADADPRRRSKLINDAVTEAGVDWITSKAGVVVLNIDAMITAATEAGHFRGQLSVSKANRPALVQHYVSQQYIAWSTFTAGQERDADGNLVRSEAGYPVRLPLTVSFTRRDGAIVIHPIGCREAKIAAALADAGAVSAQELVTAA